MQVKARRVRWSEVFYPYGSLLLGLCIFAVFALGIHRGFAFDSQFLSFLHTYQTPVLDRWALLCSRSGSALILAPLSALVLLWAYRRRANWPAFALAVGGSALLNQAAKHLFARGRPHLFPQLTPERDFGFPSGHAMGSLAFVLGLYLLLWPVAPKTARLILALGLPWTLLVGLSRLYLQVHYPSDVLAGWALTVAWSAGIWSWSRRR